MAYGEAETPQVPGLNKVLKVQDLEESRNIYNTLPDDSQQPEILKSHISNIAALLIRNCADEIFGIHLAHAHYITPEHTITLGVNYDKPHCRWARPAAVNAVDLNNIHGHIFVLTDHGFHPYEYQTGPMPDLSEVSSTFLQELADYLQKNNLESLVGLQVIDQYPANMWELILPLGTVMLDASVLKGCAATRQTGWKFKVENGEPRRCQANEMHARTATKHEIYNKGDPHPRLETFEDLCEALLIIGILDM